MLVVPIGRSMVQPLARTSSPCLQRSVALSCRRASCAQDDTQVGIQKAVLRRSPLHGLGVFACRLLKKGEVVERSPCLEVARSCLLPAAAPLAAGLSLSRLGSSKAAIAAAMPEIRGQPSGEGPGVNLLDYLFYATAAPSRSTTSRDTAASSPDETLLLPLGCGLAYNHGGLEGSNVDYEVCHGGVGTAFEIVFRATHDVAAGQELLIDYGEDWWRDRGWWPLSAGSSGSAGLAAMRRRLGHQRELSD
mmetsp:Transcript_14797/g.40595  ORF Transcript_14797/g.40595 Transcript_14797/m.40595 type:complete len:248 (-) Transcript_14797:82-825(-)